jgi:histidyl-tRNA synthetase
VELFRGLGLAGRLELQINSLGDAACRPAYRERLVAYLRASADALCAECRDRTERNPLRVLDCKRPECRPVLEAAPALEDHLCAPCATHFARVRRYLDAMKLAHVVNPRLVRGFDYYVRTAFELTTTELGAQNAVAGGGRYDGLIELLGGPPDPGVGFAIGLERVVLLLKDASPPPRRPLALLIPLGDEALTRLLPVAQALRARGVHVEIGHGERKLRPELERANKLGAASAVIVGETELARDEAILRTMASGTQRTVALGALEAELLALDEPA